MVMRSLHSIVCLITLIMDSTLDMIQEGNSGFTGRCGECLFLLLGFMVQEDE
jgi:hypothetical protein